MKNRAAPTPAEVEAIAKLARTIGENPRDRESLSLAAEQIATGNGELVFNGLFDTQRGTDGDDASAINGTMSLLESMMGTSPGVGGYLMARLYPIARRRYFHHTCDAIELWMADSTSEELAENLSRLAKEGVRPVLRRSYEAWAAQIRQFRKPAG
ncbi:hypothetical protein [Polyangium sp. 15x6]|uniref:hypothetical protein n=1 Tax=Polyangium sp. 15x6 TaxID=3042687 RepID=UPI002499EF46|nr:hypothetical protein [Polyangium sp. 15x6]MDI3288315.1 hypothetical protein [Polyangium sp. 15x6]